MYVKANRSTLQHQMETEVYLDQDINPPQLYNIDLKLRYVNSSSDEKNLDPDQFLLPVDASTGLKRPRVQWPETHLRSLDQPSRGPAVDLSPALLNSSSLLSSRSWDPVRLILDHDQARVQAN